jgi:molecular chaperone GrpE (heat shock protein)
MHLAESSPDCVLYGDLEMWSEKLQWFQRKKIEREASQQLIMDEFQGIKKLFRKQSILLEEVRREQQAAAAEASRDMSPLVELSDAVFYLQRAFRPPGLMSRQHAQVLNLVIQKMERFAASFDLEMIQEEGTFFDPEIHEAVENRSPGAQSLEILEVVQPGYRHKDNVLRPAKVIVGAAGGPTLTPEGMRRR